MIIMEQSSDINSWKKLIGCLSEDGKKIHKEDLNELDCLFKHLSATKIPPRLQKDYDSCIVKSNQLFQELFDSSLDLSDKDLLKSYLQLLNSYGYFRIAHISYHIPPIKPFTLQLPRQSSEDEEQSFQSTTDYDPIYFPQIVKTKWYDLKPLLPEAGTLGWKSILNHGLVKEEKELMNICIELLSQKLHFYSILINLDQYEHSRSRIRKNGEKVFDKLFELIKDVAYDDDNMIGLDSSLFNLLIPFTNHDQQATIIDAIIQDLFKSYSSQTELQHEQIAKIYQFIDCSIMDQASLQNFLVTQLLEHLKCNILRRKRRHSVENTLNETEVSLEILLQAAANDKPADALTDLDKIDLNPKNFQLTYLQHWIKVIDRTLSQRTLRAQNSLKLLSTCSILLLSASNFLNHDLKSAITILMAKIIDFTAQNRNDKLFNTFDPTLMIELTKIFTETTDLMSSSDSNIQKFYKSYFNRYIRYSILKNDRSESEKLEKFVEFICDKNIGKDTSHLMQYICIHELANCLDVKGNNKLMEIYLGCARTCSKKLYKFIRRNLSLDIIRDNGDDVVNGVSNMNSSRDSIGEFCSKRALVIDALVRILRIAIERKDEALLDSYGDLLLKLFNSITNRVEDLIEIVQNGQCSNSVDPIDSHISRLLLLYRENKTTINGYLNYDLLTKLAELIVAGSKRESYKKTRIDYKANKKSIYNQTKEKLNLLEKRALESKDMYPTIINKQYGSIVDPSIVTIDIKKENSCCQDYWNEMKTLHEVYNVTFSSCEFETYKKMVEVVVEELEHCDHLNHTRLLYLLLLLELSVPKYHYAQAKNTGQHFECFKDKLTRISTSLIRITKMVELGPSIHVFINSGMHKSGKGVQCCTYANCIKIFTQIFHRFPTKSITPFVTDAIQICVSSNLAQYAKYSERLHRFFILLASAITGLLKSLYFDKREEDVVKSSMPLFLTVFSNLIRCLVLASDVRKLDAQAKIVQNGVGKALANEDGYNQSKNYPMDMDYELQLELLALDIGRILNSLCSLRVKLVDYAPHLISTYVKDIQRASCPDFVRIHLNEGIFRIFNVVDAHQKERLEEIVETGVQRKTTAGHASGSLFDMIHARLDQASREIFKDMHDNYNKFHRYKGKC